MWAGLGRRSSVLRRGGRVGLGLVLFVLALELVKSAAGGLLPVLQLLDATGVRGAMGCGWLLACLVLSGSPVAAVALALLAGGTLTPAECFAMIVGSRLGASSVVLLAGALDDARAGRSGGPGAYVGAAAFVTTCLTYLPAMALGLHGLEAGWLSGFKAEGRALAPVVALLSGPIAAAGARALHPLALFGAGVLLLLLAFRIVDGALPEAAGQQRRLLRWSGLLERPALLFGAGLVVTALTMSVSLSLAILVPLAARGYLRRELLWAFILGANITTFDDTLLAAALLGHPDALRIVALLAGAVTFVSAPLLLLAPRGFGGLVDRIASRATRDGAALAGFVALLLLVPALLIAL